MWPFFVGRIVAIGNSVLPSQYAPFDAGSRRLRLRENGPAAGDVQRPWPLYPLEPKRTYVNIGFWSSVPTVPGEIEGAANRRIEHKVAELDGHKSLYSDAFYSREDFDALYGGADYRPAKRRYDPDARLLDLYQKAVQRQ